MLIFNGQKIAPLMFPDGTSQVWKVPGELQSGDIVWRFEHEGELMHVAQLSCLIKGEVRLVMPYMPYARQDKEISNEQTFALRPFASLINKMQFKEVLAVDVHNVAFTKDKIDRFTNIEPIGFHTDVTNAVDPDLVIFPDAGAKARYQYIDDYPIMVFSKKRDQSTGKILGFEAVEKPEEVIKQKSVGLIIDDICDGGATFLGIAEEVKKTYSQMKLHLAVTHGLFSKGQKVLTDAGLTLHTTNSLVRNPNGFPVEEGLWKT
jgi:ribose-phosphate pyrophosphokinase